MQDELQSWSDDEDGALESVSEGISGPEMDSDDDEPVHDVSDVLSDDAIELDEFGRMRQASTPSASHTPSGTRCGTQSTSTEVAPQDDSTPDATPDTTLDMSEDSDDEARKPSLTARPSLATIPRKPSYSSDVPTVKAHMRGASTSAVVLPRPPAASHTRGSSTGATVMAHRRTVSALPHSQSPPSHSRTSSSSGSGSGCSGGRQHSRTASRSSGAASPFGPSPIVTARRPPPISVPGGSDGVVILPPPRSASLSAPTSAKLIDTLDAMPATAVPRVLDPDNGTEELVTVRPSLEFDKGAETETLETVDTPDEHDDEYRAAEGKGGQMPRSHTQETVMPRSATQETVTSSLPSAPSQRFFPDLDDEGWEGEAEAEAEAEVSGKVTAEGKGKGDTLADVAEAKPGV